jgi:hypothetical protein
VPGLDRLREVDPDAAARLEALVRAAEARQEAEAAAAADEALRLVPRPVRGLVRKVLLG